jgi:hypothetical protein
MITVMIIVEETEIIEAVADARTIEIAITTDHATTNAEDPETDVSALHAIVIPAITGMSVITVAEEALVRAVDEALALEPTTT